MPPEQCSSPLSHSQAFPQRCVPNVGHPFPKLVSLSSCLLFKLLWPLPEGLSWIYSFPIFLLGAHDSLCLCLLHLDSSPKLWFSIFTLTFILIARDNIERYHQGQRDHLYLDAPSPLSFSLEKGSPCNLQKSRETYFLNIKMANRSQGLSRVYIFQDIFTEWPESSSTD